MSFRIEAVAFDDPRAVALRRVLDDDLDRRYGPLHVDEPPEIAERRRHALAMHPEELSATLLALDEDGTALGHVVLRRLGAEWELKRLVVADTARRRGVGRALTLDVVDRARAHGARRVILQSGPQQPESLAMYRTLGFSPIAVYEPYAETMPDSLCFERVLDDGAGA